MMYDHIDVVQAVLMVIAFLAGLVTHCLIDWYLLKSYERWERLKEVAEDERV